MNHYEVTYVDKTTKQIKTSYIVAEDISSMTLYSDNIEKIISIRESEAKDGRYAVVYESSSRQMIVETFDNYADAKEKLQSEIEWCIEHDPIGMYFYSIKWFEC